MSEIGSWIRCRCGTEVICCTWESVLTGLREIIGSAVNELTLGTEETNPTGCMRLQSWDNYLLLCYIPLL